MLKAKTAALFMVPAATAYTLGAGYFFKGDSQAFLDWTVLKNAAILAIAGALVQDIVPRNLKEVLVFFRISDRLPGCRAFQQRTSDRFDLSRITNLSELESLSGEAQQQLFYRVYCKHRENETVAARSFRFIAWRDTATLLVLLSVVTIPVASLSGFEQWIGPSIKLTAASLAGYFLTALAARANANNLVTQVLSCETMEPPHAVE